MKPLLAIIKKEIKGYVDHPIAYILAIVFLVINNFLYFRTGLLQEVASLRAMFTMIPWILIFFIPALTMRTWAEERKQQTLSVLLSYPVKVWQIIVGKYLATLLFFTVVLALTLIIPLSMGMAGDFDWGVIVAQYLAAFLLAAALVAVGQWASSLSKNQVVSFIIAIAVLIAFYLVGLEVVVLSLPYPLDLIAQQLGVLGHFNSLARGVLDVRDILYFISLAFVFLALSYAWLTKLKIIKTSKAWRTLQSSILILIAIAVVINLFGQRFTVRADLTEQNLYSLSPATKTVLRNLDDTVRFTLFRSKKLPTQVELVGRDVQDILGDYQKFGGRHVDIKIKYPDQDEEAAKEAQQAGIPAIQFNVLREAEFTLQEGFFGLNIEFLDQKESIPFVQSIDDLEYRLTSAITGMQSDKTYRLGFVSDFGGKQLSELGNVSQVLGESFTVEQLVLSTTEEDQPAPEIDDSIDVLLIAGPSKQFSEPALAEIRDYISKGGKILWMLAGAKVNQQNLSAQASQTGLEAILKEQGITLNQDLVADLSAHETVTFSAGIFSYILPYPLWIKSAVEKHVIAGNIGQVTFPWPSSLTIAEDAQDKVSIINQTTENAVRQIDSFILDPNSPPDFQAMTKSQAVLAVAIENVPATEGEPSGRWVVMASNDFIDQGIVQQHPQNLALVMNSLDWLVQNDALLSIRSKSSQPNALIWDSNKQQSFVKWGNNIGIPILVAIGGAIWLWRRRRLSR